VTKSAVREHLKKNRNPHIIAALTGSKVSEVREIMKTEELVVLPGWGK
jgi:lipid A disaccharide synthetase